MSDISCLADDILGGLYLSRQKMVFFKPRVSMAHYNSFQI